MDIPVIKTTLTDTSAKEVRFVHDNHGRTRNVDSAHIADKHNSRNDAHKTNGSDYHAFIKEEKCAHEKYPNQSLPCEPGKLTTHICEEVTYVHFPDAANHKPHKQTNKITTHQHKPTCTLYHEPEKLKPISAHPPVGKNRTDQGINVSRCIVHRQQTDRHVLPAD